jgi:hypothetical protein
MLVLPGIVGLILLFIDGLIFGIALRKGLTAVLLIIAGFILAGFIGLAIPYLTMSDFSTRFFNFMSAQATNIGAIIYGFPIAWIIGLIVGLVM